MRIAVLEDEPDQLAQLVRVLQEQFTQGDVTSTCVAFADGRSLQRTLRRETFDLIVLDWNVPGLDGAELLQWLRTWQKSPVPVLMLSSRSSERDVAKALGLGADDYMVKPVRLLELRARLQRLLKRSHSLEPSDRRHFGRWEFDQVSHSVLIHPEHDDGAPPRRQELSSREFKLALMLFQNIGHVVSRAHLLESAGYDGDLPSRTLDMHIYRLRNKLELEAAQGLTLRTVYGRGYCLDATLEAAA